MHRLNEARPVTITSAPVDLNTRWARLPTEPVALKILDDFKKGRLSVFASKEELEDKYGKMAFGYYKM